MRKIRHVPEHKEPVRAESEPARNSQCPCGSGKKSKSAVERLDILVVSLSHSSILCAVAAPHQIHVIILGAQLGVRVGPSELYKLRWQDIDFPRAAIRITAAKKRPDQPWREVPIRDSLKPMLEAWKQEDALTEAEYVINWKGKQVESTKRSWHTALRRAGITRNIRPYDLRHAFAPEAIAAGADVGTVANIMWVTILKLCLTITSML